MKTGSFIGTLLGDGRYKWAITGVAGFIGSHLLQELLANGQDVVGIDNMATGKPENLEEVRHAVGENWKNFRFVEGDIRDLKSCVSLFQGVDFVLHHAALGSVPGSIDNPLLCHDVNVSGFANVLVASRNASVKRVIYASSSAIYGDNPNLPLVENSLFAPLSPYAASKAANELYSTSFQNSFGLESIGLRYFNIFGERQDPKGAYAAVIPAWITALLGGREAFINGDGSSTRDFLYVKNVVEVNILAALSQKPTAGSVYNVGHGYGMSLTSLYQLISEIIAEDAGHSIRPANFRDFRAGDIQHSFADTRSLNTRLEYAPNFSLAEGLKKTIRWYSRKI